MKAVRILFLNLPNDCAERKFFSLPLGLASLAAMLAQPTYALKGLDLAATKEKGQNCYLQAPAQYLQEILDFKPDYVLISCLVHNRFNVFFWAKQIKQNLPGAKIIIGNHFATCKPREILGQVPEIDYIVLGEGEKNIKALIEGLEKNNLDNIKDIAYRRGEEVVVSESGELVDVNKLPLAKIDIFQPQEYAFVLGDLKFNKVIPIVASRGCPMLCTFCACRVFEGNQYRFRSADNLIEEIIIRQQEGFDTFMFVDDTFTVNRQHLLDFCRKVIAKKLKFKWICWSCLNIRPDVLAAMKAAGCIFISFGLESANLQILKQLRKNINLELAREVIKECQKLQIDFRLTLIFNSGYETPDTLEETLKFLEEMNVGKGMVDSADGIWVFPGTDLEKQFLASKLKKFDWFCKGDYDYEVEKDRSGNCLVPLFKSDYKKQFKLVG